MIQFADYIKTKEEIVVSDSGYSQLEIENLLQQIFFLQMYKIDYLRQQLRHPVLKKWSLRKIFF